MKKLFWCGCAVAVLVAAGVYVAADYVGRHPESMFSQCIATACRISTVNNPLLHASRGSLRAQAKVSEADCEESESGSDTRLPFLSTAEFDLDCPNGLVLPCPAMPVEMGSPPLSVPDAAAPQDDFYRPMPPCPQDETTPMTPEPSPDSGPGAVLTEFWKKLHHEVLDRGHGEECDTIHSGKPPTCRENDDCMHQYPGCPQSSRVCPYTGRIAAPESKADVSEEQEMLPPPRKVRLKDTPTDHEGCPECPSCCPKCKPMPKADTSEFRPTDARKGEFDRIPF